MLLVCRRWRRLVASRELVRCLELHTSRSSPGRCVAKARAFLRWAAARAAEGGVERLVLDIGHDSAAHSAGAEQQEQRGEEEAWAEEVMDGLAEVAAAAHGTLRELGLRAAHLPLHLSGRWASQLAGGLRTLDLCLLEQRGQHEVPLTVSAPLARFTALHSLRLAAYAVRWDPEARLPTCLTRLALGMAGDASGESAGFALGSLPHLVSAGSQGCSPLAPLLPLQALVESEACLSCALLSIR